MLTKDSSTEEIAEHRRLQREKIIACGYDVEAWESESITKVQRTLTDPEIVEIQNQQRIEREKNPLYHRWRI